MHALNPRSQHPSDQGLCLRLPSHWDRPLPMPLRAEHPTPLLVIVKQYIFIRFYILSI
jgi:hypothetical protein